MGRKGVLIHHVGMKRLPEGGRPSVGKSPTKRSRVRLTIAGADEREALNAARRAIVAKYPGLPFPLPEQDPKSIAFATQFLLQIPATEVTNREEFNQYAELCRKYGGRLLDIVLESLDGLLAFIEEHGNTGEHFVLNDVFKKYLSVLAVLLQNRLLPEESLEKMKTQHDRIVERRLDYINREAARAAERRSALDEAAREFGDDEEEEEEAKSADEKERTEDLKGRLETVYNDIFSQSFFESTTRAAESGQDPMEAIKRKLETGGGKFGKMVNHMLPEIKRLLGEYFPFMYENE